MLRHIVCFKLKDNTPVNCAKARDVLLSMRGRVPQIRDIEVGVDLLHSPRSFDLILQVTLDDQTALDAYQADSFHVEVVKKHMHAVAAASVAVDYEL